MNRLLLLLLLFAFLLSCSSVPKNWEVPKSLARLSITVDAGDFDRLDKPVEVDLNLVELFQIDPEMDAAFRLFEVDKNGTPIGEISPIQINPNVPPHKTGAAASDSSVKLTFIMPGMTPIKSSRYFHLYRDKSGLNRTTSSTSVVSVSSNVPHEGQESFEIKTPSCTYFYHRYGAGFASMDDIDGNDWLSYNPGVGEKSQSGSGGMYRGLPNSGYPEGYNHPGKEVSDSWIIEPGPIKVSILSESRDQKMRCVWDIFPNYARLTFIKMRSPYWFLYEGTPGGTLEEESDFCVRLGNIKTLCSEKWNGDIEANGETGEWLYFSDVHTKRSLFLVQNRDDANADSYWPMNNEMTVFGFGRLDMVKSMERQNNQFTIGLTDAFEYEDMKRIIDSAYQPLNIKVGSIEMIR